MIMETNRLIIRPLSVSDAEDMYEYSKNPNVGPNAGWMPHESVKETRKIIRKVFLVQPYVFGMVLKSNGKLIGTLGLIADPKREYEKVKMLGYAMSEDYWGNGYMTEACEEVIRYGFEDLKLEMISCYCYPFNINSSNVMKRLGFTYEGRLALCEERFDGKVLDSDCYKLTKDQYKSFKRRKVFNS